VAVNAVTFLIAIIFMSLNVIALASSYFEELGLQLELQSKTKRWSVHTYSVIKTKVSACSTSLSTWREN
jgi:hypothetical protein